MPLTEKGNKILSSMEKTYGPKKGEEVFYASRNKGTVSGVDSKGQIMSKDVEESSTPVPATSMPAPDKPAPQVFDARSVAPNEISMKMIKDEAKRLLGPYPARGSK